MVQHHLQNPILSRRQQKISLLALGAALGSFIVGVMLPWNLRSDQLFQDPPASEAAPEVSPPTPTPEPSQPQSSSTPTPEAPTFQPTKSTQTTAKTTVAQSSDENLSENEGIDSSVESLKVAAAISQRVEWMETNLTELEKQRFNYAIPKKFQRQQIEQVTLKKNQKVVALTFDDGPWPKTTEQILEILRKEKIKGTFFWVGSVLERYPEIAQKVAQEGHAIANHTWTHNYAPMSQKAAANEIERTSKLIEELTGIKTFLFRPPGGVQDNGLVDYIYSKNYVNVMWSSDSFDWNDSTQGIIDNVLQTAKPGGIVLMHDGGGNRTPTVQALPTIIDELKQQGYKFVTVNELLRMGDVDPPVEEADAEKADSDELEAQTSVNTKTASRLRD